MVNRERKSLFTTSAGLGLLALGLAACSASSEEGNTEGALTTTPTGAPSPTVTQSTSVPGPAPSPTPSPTMPTPSATQQPLPSATVAGPTGPTAAPSPTGPTATPSTPALPTAPDPTGPTGPVGEGGAGGGGSDDPTGAGGSDDAAGGEPPMGAGGEMPEPDPGPGPAPDDGTEYGGGPARKLGYLGCSMSQNTAEGYASLGGEYLWPVMGAYGAQVVQNWTGDGGPWSAGGGFESGIAEYGQPQAVWVMLCIFSNMVTLEEAKQIVDNVRERAPDAQIFITGQPLNSGTDCFLAGDGGAALTDRIAQEVPGEAGYEDVIYAGTFGPLSPEQRSDGCHANADGMRLLGEQVIQKWGK